MAYIIDADGYLVWVSDAETPTITAEDGTGDTITPLALTGWDATADSANVVHTLIDGSIAVTLIGDLPRAGELPLIFGSDLAAEDARAILARPTSFTLTVPNRPSINMRFVRAGSIGTPIHDEVHEVWEFSIGYQEVLP